MTVWYGCAGLLALATVAAAADVPGGGRLMRPPVDMSPGAAMASRSKAVESLRTAMGVFATSGSTSSVFVAAIQGAAAGFPLLDVSTNWGKAVFTALTMDREGIGLDGIRFRVPECVRPSMVVFVRYPAGKGLEWYVVPAKGGIWEKVRIDREFVRCSNLVENVGGEATDRGVVMWVPGLVRRAEYIMWFRSTNRSPWRTSMAISAVSGEQGEILRWAGAPGGPSRRSEFEDAKLSVLGLHRRLAPLAELVRGCRDGDVAMIDHAIEAGASVRDAPVMLEAAAHANAATMQHLLERGADPNAVNSGRTVVLALCQMLTGGGAVGDPARCKALSWLLAHGADPNRQDRDGVSPLHIAVGKNAEPVEALLRAGASLEARDADGRTPVDAAIALGNREMLANVLHTLGMEVEWPAPTVDELVQLVGRRETNEVAAIIQSDPALVNGVSAHGYGPLDTACIYGHADLVRLLLARGADPNGRSTVEGRTVLQAAVRGGNRDIIQMLLEQGADINATDSRGRTALDVAEGRKDIKVAAFLKVKGARGGGAEGQ